MTEEPAPRLTDLVVITGFSGAGKSEAMNCFEDAGYFCVDNLPPAMIGSLSEVFEHRGTKVERAAVVSDCRGGAYFEELVRVLDELKARGLKLRILFLEAGEPALLRRFTETRRRHPLAPSGRVLEGIRAEQDLLAPVRSRADTVVDTTDYTANMLRQRILSELIPTDSKVKLAVTLMSFGYKHGTPRDADLMFDVRFLPNPFYVTGLRDMSGLDSGVIEYVRSAVGIDGFYDLIFALLAYLLPRYVEEGKAHLTIGIGCTGGRHRSVVVAERIALELRGRDDSVVKVIHRDIDRTR